MAINLTKVLCTSAVAALLVCGNAYAGTAEVTNNTKEKNNLVLTIKGTNGEMFAKTDKKAVLKCGDKTTVTVNPADIKGATTYTLSADDMMDGACKDLSTGVDYIVTFSDDTVVGTKCISQPK